MNESKTVPETIEEEGQEIMHPLAEFSKINANVRGRQNYPASASFGIIQLREIIGVPPNSGG